jgi:hypothetical protein
MGSSARGGLAPRSTRFRFRVIAIAPHVPANTAVAHGRRPWGTKGREHTAVSAGRGKGRSRPASAGQGKEKPLACDCASHEKIGPSMRA